MEDPPEEAVGPETHPWSYEFPRFSMHDLLELDESGGMFGTIQVFGLTIRIDAPYMVSSRSGRLDLRGQLTSSSALTVLGIGR